MAPMAEEGRSLPELPSEVVGTIMRELPKHGEKVVTSLRTAAVLIGQAMDDDLGLRFAESAVYNVREAVGAVTSGHSPVAGGLPAVLDGWKPYEEEIDQPGNDDSASLDAFKDVLRRMSAKRDLNSYHAARLLGYLQLRSGVQPLQGELSPVEEYSRLYGEASQGLHSGTALQAAIALYNRAVAWFVRMFTPPDEIVRGLRVLAAEPWRGPDQIARLRELASNEHHLRLFLGHLVDPAWLVPLYDAGVVALPRSGGPWPLAGLLETLGRTSSAEVVAVLERLLGDSKRLPEDDRVDVRFNLLIAASQLGAAGYGVVGDIVVAHSGNRAVRAIGCGVVQKADPTDPLVERVATAILNAAPFDSDRYYYTLLLGRLEDGVNDGNVARRVRMVAAKMRMVSQHPQADWIVLDIAKLTADLGEHERHYLVVVAHSLARLLEHAHRLGIGTSQMLEWTEHVAGQLGERITCRILALADDIPLQDKINHVTRRLASSTATGDDMDLVESVLAANPEPAALAAWTEALGSPGAELSDTDAIPSDLLRAWWWSMIMPKFVMVHWQTQITSLTERHGPLQTEVLEHRTDHASVVSAQSAYSVDELLSLPVAEAAERVARWRPDATSRRRLIVARELARALQSVAEANPAAWTVDPVSVVTTLREPVYVLHYIDALATKVAEVVPNTPGIMAAARLVRAERWIPTNIGDDDYDFEPNWHRVDTAIVDLVGALANHDAPFAEHLDTAWKWASDLIDSTAVDRDNAFAGHDALTRAINNPRGRGLQTIIALAGWEFRSLGAIRKRFVEVLDEVVRIPGTIGMEYRAILAERRVFLETIAKDWLDHNVEVLFRDHEQGQETFELTLKYTRQATPWFYRNLREDLFAAAARYTDNAIGFLLIGTLHNEPGFEIATIIHALRGRHAALASAAAEIAFLVQNSADGAPELDTAVDFWRALLDANRVTVPAEVLRSAGRWAFVTGLSEAAWAHLMVRTLRVTNGMIDLIVEVADRCRTAPIPGDSTKIFLLLLGKGDPWEKDHVARAAIDALRAISASRPDHNFHELRSRLIERGYHEATDITPYDTPDES